MVTSQDCRYCGEAEAAHSAAQLIDCEQRRGAEKYAELVNDDARGDVAHQEWKDEGASRGEAGGRHG
jgi:hypothetical protein